MVWALLLQRKLLRLLHRKLLVQLLSRVVPIRLLRKLLRLLRQKLLVQLLLLVTPIRL
jgi:hypothetical protein